MIIIFGGISTGHILYHILPYTFQETYIDRGIEDSLLYIYIYILIIIIIIIMIIIYFIMIIIIIIIIIITIIIYYLLLLFSLLLLFYDYYYIYIYIFHHLSVKNCHSGGIQSVEKPFLTACETRCVDAAESSPLRRLEVAAGDTQSGCTQQGPPNGKNSRFSPAKIGDSIINHGNILFFYGGLY